MNNDISYQKQQIIHWSLQQNKQLYAMGTVVGICKNVAVTALDLFFLGFNILLERSLSWVLQSLSWIVVIHGFKVINNHKMNAD